MATAPTPFVWGRGGRRMTPEEIAREREIADKLGMQAGDTSPVGHWTQGAARVVNALGGVLADRRANAAMQQNAAEDKTALTGLLGLLGGGSSMSPTTANVASALVPSDGGMPAQTAMVEGQPPVPGLQRAPSPLPASFLAAVDRTEGAGGYDTLFGHAQKGKFAGTDISAMPIRDVIAFTDPSGPYAQSVKSQIGRVATPVGRYQVVGTTLRNAVSELGLDPNTPFNAATQDMVAKHLATRRIANAGSLPQKISALRSEWEGFKGVPDDQMAQIVADLEGGAAMSAQPGAAATASVPMSGAATAYVDPYVSVQPSSAAAQPAPATPAPVPAPAASGGIMDEIAPPMTADYFPPAPAAPQAGAIDPAVIEALSSPYASPQTKQVASMLLERTMTQQQQAQERALQEQQRAQEIQRRQQIAQAAGIDPAYAMDDAMWAEAAKSPFAAPSTSTVGNVVIDNRTGQPLYEGQPEATTGMRDYEAYAAQVEASGGTPLGRLEYEQALRASGAPRTEAAIPAGYRAVRDAQGNLMSYEPIPGGPAALEAQNAATAAERKQGGQDTASDIVQSAALKAAQALSADGMPATGTLGKAMSFLPESNAAEVRRQVAVLKANATLEGLNAMRASSPTGAALGSVTEGEGEKLAARAGTLDPDSPNFDRDLKDYTKAVLEYIHGPDAGREIYNSMQWGGAADAPQSGDSPPAGVDPEDWKFMTPEERRLFQ